MNASKPVRPHTCLQCGITFSNYGVFAKRNHEVHCNPCDDLVHSADDDNDDECDVPEPSDDFQPQRLNSAVETVCTPGLEDFQHLNQFLTMGRCPCTEEELQVVKFVNMAHEGYGVSRHFSETMLNYCKSTGGLNVHLPDTWKRCVEITTDLIEKLEGKRHTFTLDVPIPMPVRVLLADPTQTTIAFEFECPIMEMIRVAMFSATCQNLDNVAFAYEENGGYLDDFCNGDRYKRITASLSTGGAILGAVLATDGICMDKWMFDSQEVVLCHISVVESGL